LKPIIGITSPYDNANDRYFMPKLYVESIITAGGIPLIIPNLEDNDIRQILDKVDGLLLSGGDDIDPVYFNEEPIQAMGEITPERDRFEIALTKFALERNCPILAICRGVQVLNIAAGGTIYQDITTQFSKAIKHSQKAPRWYGTHKIEIKPQTKLNKLLKIDYVRVNSFHHQGIKDLGEHFVINALSLDGLIEGIESISHEFVIGAQWHPECMWVKTPLMLELFTELIAFSKGYRGTS
jgi:putative glutamine amidotransferase